MRVYGKQLTKDHSILVFYILAFFISWAGWIPLVASEAGILSSHSIYLKLFLVFPGIGPAAAAIITLRLSGNKDEIKNIFRQLIHAKVRLVDYLFAVFIPLTLLMITLIIDQFFLNISTPSLPKGSSFMVLSTLITSLLANPWEEFGWRGYAFPRLQLHYGMFNAALITGIFSGLWHLPIFFLPSEMMAGYPYHFWFISIVAVSFLYAWLYNNSNGSLLISSLFHITLNVFSVIIGINSFATYATVTICFALIFILLVKRKG